MVILLLFFIGNSVPVFSQTDYNIKSITDINKFYQKVENSEWEKYFENFAKYYKKSWKKNKQIFQDKKYKTSYARVLFVIDKDGNVLSQIKSSCVPHGDTIFLAKVRQTINSGDSYTPLPTGYDGDYIIFTVKFHTNLPYNLKDKSNDSIDWDRYGIADIELDNRDTKIILKDKPKG